MGNDKRIVTVVVELQGDDGNWIWDVHLKGPLNGLRLKDIRRGKWTLEQIEQFFTEN